MALTSSSGVGTCGPDDNQAQAGHLVTQTHTFQKVIRSGERDVNGDLPPEVWAEREVAATLNLNDLGSESRAVELVVQPLALRGREDGANLEIGPEGGPYNALRAGDGGSSRQSLNAETVRSHPRPGSNSLGGTVFEETTVRRLTPTECERLQGFPDGWTETSNGQPQADSPRYKQMGNAVAVPVFEWVARRLVAYEEER